MHARRQTAQVARRFSRADLDKTQVIPAVPTTEPDVVEATSDETQVLPTIAPVEADRSDRDLDQTQVIPAVTAESVVDEPDDAQGRHRAPSAEDTVVAVPAESEAPTAAVDAESETEQLQKPSVVEEPAATAAEPVVDVPVEDDDELEASPGRHWAEGDDAAVEAVSEPEREPEPEAEPEPAPELEAEPEPEPEPEPDEAPPAAVDVESATERLHRLLAFVVRQEPRLNWAVGDLADGTTLLVTDLAHGWIPSGIMLPVGVRLLAPGRRRGKASALLGEATRTATYTPGDPVGRPADFAETESTAAPRELPPVEDLGWELGRVTHWRDGLPRLVHTLAKAATAGTGVVEEEADLLRVHLETARYQLLNQYPDLEPALLLNCLLLAATESSVAGDATSANYHLAWFQKLDEPPASQWTAES
ncbi:DUF5631 domain-containing protein [Mycobacterium sp. Aquia_216]|uniref:DUF5631 domain-containing protein n=1 Tax=Mycobacterium sp. Aquia_216 TaxID=2991729 RepID=UPI002DD65700|nr:DUF5631 domain-containing protein [Mycobacterium sp. Aquia_216]